MTRKVTRERMEVKTDRLTRERIGQAIKMIAFCPDHLREDKKFDKRKLTRERMKVKIEKLMKMGHAKRLRFAKTYTAGGGQTDR